MTSQDKTIICTMCKKEEQPIAPGVAKQVEEQLLAGFNITTSHLNIEEYGDGCYRLLMLTYRITAKLRRKKEAAQRVQEGRTKIEYKPIAAAIKRPAPEREEMPPPAKRMRPVTAPAKVAEKKKDDQEAVRSEISQPVQRKRRIAHVRRSHLEVKNDTTNNFPLFL